MPDTSVPGTPGLSEKLGFCIPSYDGTVTIPTCASLLNACVWLLTNPKRNVEFMWPINSLLCRAFNMGWAQALCYRPDMTRWVMLHSDVAPIPENWIDILLDVMEEHKCHVMSVVVPIKLGDGRSTSTGWEEFSCPAGQVGADRLQMHLDPTETEGGRKYDGLLSMPETITDTYIREKYNRRLLINTGCMMVKFDEPWVAELAEEIVNGLPSAAFRFNIKDWITKDENGTFGTAVLPEDWHMSQWLSDRGIPYGCTREIPVCHIGQHTWRLG